MLALLLLACSAKPEPIDLPGDPAARAAPVGIQTIQARGQRFEVFYPAPDSTEGSPTENTSFLAFIPESFTDHVGDVDLPRVNVGLVRDAPLRVPDDPYPVVLFSHGFGGMRRQSLDLAGHLASRGYVVVAVDHPGRMLNDVLPCLFDPALDGCDLEALFASIDGEDPAIEDLEDALIWVDNIVDDDESFLYGAIDTSLIGVMGHSAGGGSVAEFAEDEPGRVKAVLAMANPITHTESMPTLLMTGACDQLPFRGDCVEGEDGDPEDPADDICTVDQNAQMVGAAVLPSMDDAKQVTIHGAGHLVFSDLCDLELGELAADVLEGRDDLNPIVYGPMVALATDGCPDATELPQAMVTEMQECDEGLFPLSLTKEITRYYATVFFDVELKQYGPGLEDDAYAEVTVE
ncbi:MAG: alpha/beta fold hydrolase [Alphaproteobacteria bacterium]|nr:alpha/beta fold hydrolase [Alphaproteobacteria bacterium]